MKKAIHILSVLLLLWNIAVCQTTKVYQYNHFTKNGGNIKSSGSAKEDHTITLIYDKDGKLIKIKDAASYRTDTYIIDKTLDPSYVYDLEAQGHIKKYPNLIFTFTHKTKGLLEEQFVITEKDKDGYLLDDGSKEKNEILTNK